VLERRGLETLLWWSNKLLFLIIALGVLMQPMHHSSLGSLLIAGGYKVSPLWQSYHMQPLLAVITALAMGFAIVIYEASVSTTGFGRPSETPLLAKLGKVIAGLLIAYFAVRFGELAVNGKLGLIFKGDWDSLWFLLETVLYAVPLAVLLNARLRQNGRALLFAAISLLSAAILYRLNAFLITYDPGPGYSYFPAFPEVMVTIGLIALEVGAWLFFVKTLPVLHDAGTHKA
ncbi:MAG: Ni/Fe-hydrogenase cytochrome b subunit, partial [Alphaproteobacteria bacterium]|nr:Ni/Fe-hydrogenase cytochrome b subunit [Alphaproteobacteria bacterium]